jgi:hypothetical protein
MQPTRGQRLTHLDHPAAAGPAVEDHGRVLTTNRQAAAWYRQAQRATRPGTAVTALRHAVVADPSFAVALADLGALTGTSNTWPSSRQMTWERHHIEVIRTAATGNTARAADLLREHLAGVGCDPLAVRIIAQFRPSVYGDDGIHIPANQFPGCHRTPWPRSS